VPANEILCPKGNNLSEGIIKYFQRRNNKTVFQEIIGSSAYFKKVDDSAASLGK
jgi:hypothetical protein